MKAWIFTKLARACGVPVGRRSGGRLAMTLVATINVIIFFFLFFLFFSSPSSTFLIEGVLGSKNLFSESWRERLKIKWNKRLVFLHDPHDQDFPCMTARFHMTWVVDFTLPPNSMSAFSTSKLSHDRISKYFLHDPHDQILLTN